MNRLRRLRHVHIPRTVACGIDYRYQQCRCGARRTRALSIRFDESGRAPTWPSPPAGWQTPTLLDLELRSAY